MKTVKITALILCAVMLTSLFCACEPGNTEDTGTGTATVEVTVENSGALTEETSPPLTEEQTGPADITDEDTQAQTEAQTEKVTEEVTTEAEVTQEETTEEITEPATEPQTTEKETEPVVIKEPATAKDLVFRQVYGTGANNDTPIKYSFIELYNSAETELDLNGLTIHSYDRSTKKTVKTNFPAVKMAPSSSYLIRCAEAVDEKGNAFKEEDEKIILKYYDLVWNIVLDNKEIVLAITDKGYTFDYSKLTTDKNIYNYFVGTQSVNSDIHAAVGISKNKAAYKTNPNSKYELFNYKTGTLSDILDHSPMCQKGDVNRTLSVVANVVQFSHEAGVYDKAFNLTLTALKGYKIYYTTDGSDPRTSGTLYKNTISITDTSAVSWGKLTRLTNSLMGFSLPSKNSQIGAKVIKAYATDGKTKTQVVTKTYFVVPGMKDYNTAVISLSLTPSDFLSNENGMYNLQMNDPFGTKLRRTAFLEMFETDGSRVSASYVEIALNGNGSLGFNAKSIRAYFKSTAAADVVGNPSKLKYDIFQGTARDNVTEYKRILFRNSGNDSSVTHMRDAYMQRLCSVLNCPTMAYRPTLMFINGEFWGVYNARERYDAKYFEAHFGIPEEDFVMLESISPLITGSWNTAYELNEGAAGDEKPFHQLVSYIENNDLSNDGKFKYVSDRIDIDNMIDFFVGSMFLCNTDWPGNNIKVWRNKNENNGMDTKWRFAFCDMDMGVGLATNIDTNMFNHAINNNTVAGRIFNRMLRNESFKQKFIDRFYECAETVFDTSRTLPILDEMYNAIKNIMPLHFSRWPGDGGSVSKFQSQVNSMSSATSIKYFMTYRKEKAIAHMEAFFHIEKMSFNISSDLNAADIYVNGDKVTSSGYTATVQNGSKISLKIEVKDGYEFDGVRSVSSNGTVKTYSTGDISFNISSTQTIIVLTKKQGMTATPAVITGSRSILVLDGDGTLYAWGANELSQDCVKTADTIKRPMVVASGIVKAAISMGGTESDAPMTAVLNADGEVYTIGNNSSGQLGRGGATYVLTKVPLDFKVKDIACGFDHMVVISESGDLYGVGNNVYGQLGEHSFGGNSKEFVKLDSNVKTAVAGRRHTLYIKENGEMYVLGDNRWNKFKAGYDEKITKPMLLGENFEFVSTGQHNCVAVDKDGNCYYFGWRDVDNFGAGGSVGGLHKFAENIKSAYIQDEHIIMLGVDGKVYGFGLNNYGQISEDKQSKNTPTFIMDGCISCGAGTHYSAAITEDGKVYVWGNNSTGVMGNGRTDDAYYRPAVVMSIK